MGIKEIEKRKKQKRLRQEAIARSKKKQITDDGKRWHQCSICRRVETWNDNWSWYGSWRDLDNDDITKFCSPACASMHQKGGE